MPNWVFNELTIQGPKDQVDYIKDKLNEPFTREHENWNMETQQYEIKTYTYSNPVFSFWNIHRPTDLVEYAKQPNYKSENPYGGNDWYSFNNREWGTKWDVAVEDNEKYPDTGLHEHMSNGEDQWLVYGFNTAWSPPIPALIKLSRMVPNCVVTLSYEEEQGWGGEIEFVNGKLTAESSYDNKCRDCDKENTLEYCENDCGEICDSCHYLGEADLEAVAECDEHKIYLDDKHVPEYRKETV